MLNIIQEYSLENKVSPNDNKNYHFGKKIIKDIVTVKIVPLQFNIIHTKKVLSNFK